MLKVVKFGGSSVASAQQFRKVRSIMESDLSRRVAVISAAGKRTADDHKMTDLLYLVHAHLRYGVPEYRLPGKVLDLEIQRILDLGLVAHTGVKVGKDVAVDELKAKFDAVVLAIGLSAGKWLPMFEGNPVVETAVSFLRRAKEALAVPREVMDTMTNFTDDPAVLYRWRDEMADLIEKAPAGTFNSELGTRNQQGDTP